MYDILRGSLDPSDYRQPIMTILFLKRLNDTFEENAEKLIIDFKSYIKKIYTIGITITREACYNW